MLVDGHSDGPAIGCRTHIFGYFFFFLDIVDKWLLRNFDFGLGAVLAIGERCDDRRCQWLGLRHVVSGWDFQDLGAVCRFHLVHRHDLILFFQRLGRLFFAARTVCDRFEVVDNLAQSNFHAQSAQFAAQTVECSGASAGGDFLALNHIGVGLMSALDIVCLDGHHLVQDIGGAVSLDSPNFHFAHSLTAVVGFSADRLLRDCCVRSTETGASIDFVQYQLVQLQHVLATDQNRAIEWLTGSAVEELHFAVGLQPLVAGHLACFFERFVDEAE